MVWASDTQFVNTALVHINRQQIDDIDDGSPTSEQLKALLPLVKEKILARHPWRCSRRREYLEMMQDAGDASLYQKKYRYKKPSWAISATLLVIDQNGFNVEWTEAGDYIYCDYSSLIVQASQSVSVDKWPVYLCDFASRVLAAEIAANIMQDTDEAKKQLQIAYGSMDQMGENGLLRTARELDGVGEPAKKLKFAVSLVDARQW